MRIAVVGGGIAGLAAARRLEALLPDAELTLVERSERLGGKLLTERVDGFVVEGAADSFLSRKERGTGLARELGLEAELVARRPENARSFVRVGDSLHPLPEGLSGLIPTNLDALAESGLLSDEGRARFAAEVDVPPAPPGDDESVASFVTRRLGTEAYERLVEPLLTGIYGGDGEQLSLRATFPQLRELELEHGSLLRGFATTASPTTDVPPFLSFTTGMQRLVDGLSTALERTQVLLRFAADRVERDEGGYVVTLRGGVRVHAEGLVLACPAWAAAKLLAGLDPQLAEFHREIPHASSAIVTLAFLERELASPPNGYGYVVPRLESADVLACTWSSNKWQGRAPAGHVLARVYAGRFGGRDVTRLAKDELVGVAREELARIGVEAEPMFARVHRWRYGMPQYVLGHPERVASIDDLLASHPGLALAGAAYRGVGIPDCIGSGEAAAEAVARALAPVAG